MRLSLWGVVVFALLVTSDAWAIKVIGRSAPAPAPEPPKAAKPAKPKPAAKPAAAKPVAAKPEPKPVAAKPEPKPVAAKPEPKPEPAAASEVSDTLVAGQVCALSKPLKAKVGKSEKTLAQGSKVTVHALAKGEATLVTSLGDAHVKRSLLAPVCSAPPPAPEPTPVVAAVVPPLAPLAPVAPVAPAKVVEAPPPVVVAPPRVEAPRSQPPKAEAPRLVQVPPPTPPALDASADNPRLSKARTMRVLAWTFSAAGVAGVATAAAFYGLNRGQASSAANAITAYNNAPLRTQSDFAALGRQRGQVQAYDTVMAVAASVGLAALVTGVVLFAVGESPSKLEATTGTTVSFNPGPGGMSVTGAF